MVIWKKKKVRKNMYNFNKKTIMYLFFLMKSIIFLSKNLLWLWK
jgi:catabolite regulation protein CreA